MFGQLFYAVSLYLSFGLFSPIEFSKKVDSSLILGVKCFSGEIPFPIFKFSPIFILTYDNVQSAHILPNLMMLTRRKNWGVLFNSPILFNKDSQRYLSHQSYFCLQCKHIHFLGHRNVCHSFLRES